MQGHQPESTSESEDKAFKYRPIILYDAPADPITIHLLRHHLRAILGAGYTAFCFEYPNQGLHEMIRILSMMQPNIKACIEELKSGRYTFISHYMREMYQDRAIAFEESFHNVIRQKIEFFEVVLAFQTSNKLPAVYGIDTANESIPYLEELKEMYLKHDFDNPQFNIVRDRVYAQHIKEAALKHEGGVLTVVNIDHFGVQNELTKILTEEQAKQFLSIYHYCYDDPCALRASKHHQDLLAGDQKALSRYKLGLEMINLTDKPPTEKAEYQNYMNAVLDKAKSGSSVAQK